jgi:hypothetical protein
MIQLSVKFSPRRIIIVCLLILATGTSVAIANARGAESIRTNFNAYVKPALDTAASFATIKFVTNELQKTLKQVR